MEYTTINKETPEMKQLISGIKEMSKCLQEIAKTHRSLFRGKIYLTRREVCLRTPFHQHSYLAGLSAQEHYSLHPNHREDTPQTLRH